MIEKLLNSPTTRMLEQAVNFTEQRHQVLLENIANLSTPEYVQKDLSVSQFQSSLREAVKRQRTGFSSAFQPASSEDVAFSTTDSGVSGTSEEVINSPVFHDKGARGIESLMGDLADNAIAHNAAAQMLKYKYDSITRAITMKV